MGGMLAVAVQQPLESHRLSPPREEAVLCLPVIRLQRPASDQVLSPPLPPQHCETFDHWLSVKKRSGYCGDKISVISHDSHKVSGCHCGS